ncbi:MAG: hypothetical protein GEV28_20735 [Actinophytocola sp.]|uniref:hypothetical protein n=1 Tax=Actinophytocola sp. TaxID=1872138 RepID=UPI00132C38C7|nr:hypothetical protein [Actinophytocola sp.]MPZ82691.1 hypothetical protein [Actinophytocola sp.]
MSGSAAHVGYGTGVAFIVLGGLVAAVTGPLQLDRGSWLAAYLVLVCGVAQCALSDRQRLLTGRPIPPRRSWTGFACWNGGNTLVMAGSLTTAPLVTDLGGIALGCALAFALADTRGARRRVHAVVFRTVCLVLLVSIPIGLTLTHLRTVPPG